MLVVVLKGGLGEVDGGLMQGSRLGEGCRGGRDVQGLSGA